MSKPTTRDGYKPEQVELVRQTCLYVATKLGDLLDDIVIVGGLAPSLLIDQEVLPEGAEAHAGTLDLDVGLAIALLDEQRYEELTARLREAGFKPDKTKDGKLVRQRWQILDGSVTLDFLIAPSLEGDRGGKLRNIESDFAAFIMPGLQLAFRDRRQVPLSGQTIMGESATRTLWVCEAGAFVVLKALAVVGRGINKDPYDLFYLLQNYEGGASAVAERLRPLMDDVDAQRAVQVLRDDLWNQRQLADHLDISRAAVSQALRVCRLDERVRVAMAEKAERTGWRARYKDIRHLSRLEVGEALQELRA